jgi:hypothetical protein
MTATAAHADADPTLVSRHRSLSMPAAPDPRPQAAPGAVFPYDTHTPTRIAPARLAPRRRGRHHLTRPFHSARNGNIAATLRPHAASHDSRQNAIKPVPLRLRQEQRHGSYRLTATRSEPTERDPTRRDIDRVRPAGSSTALLLGHRRSRAVRAHRRLEDDSNRTRPATGPPS